MLHPFSLHPSILKNCSNTLAPLSKFPVDVYSFGLWLTPSLHGMKIRPLGHLVAMFMTSCPAPLSITIYERPFCSLAAINLFLTCSSNVIEWLSTRVWMVMDTPCSFSSCTQ